eukprot:tig00000178_g12800.t1
MKADESARQGATRDAASKKSTTSRDFWLLLQLCAALSLSIAVAAVAMGHSGALGRLGLVTHSELGTKLEAAHAALRAEMEELRARLKDHASQAERNAELDAIISKLLEEKRALHAQVEEWKLNATQCGGLVDKLRANKKALAKNYIAFQEENAALQKDAQACKSALQAVFKESEAEQAKLWQPWVYVVYSDIKSWWYSKKQE